MYKTQTEFKHWKALKNSSKHGNAATNASNSRDRQLLGAGLFKTVESENKVREKLLNTKHLQHLDQLP